MRLPACRRILCIERNNCLFARTASDERKLYLGYSSLREDALPAKPSSVRTQSCISRSATDILDVSATVFMHISGVFTATAGLKWIIQTAVRD